MYSEASRRMQGKLLTAAAFKEQDYNRLLENEFTEEEDERYYEALKIFCNDGKIYLMDCKDYDSNILKFVAKLLK